MSKQNKSLALANPSANTSTVIYTVPAGKYAVAKSVTIANTSVTDANIRLIVGGSFVIFDHKLKGRDTLVIKDFDFPLLPGETISVVATNTSCIFKVSGFEDDYVEVDYPYLKVNVVPTSTDTVIPKTSDVVIRSIIICNIGAANNITNVNAPWVVVYKEIKPYDSLLLLNLQYYVPDNHNISHQVVSGTNSRITFILEKVAN